jgi:hypothetical protein
MRPSRLPKNQITAESYTAIRKRGTPLLAAWHFVIRMGAAVTNEKAAEETIKDEFHPM